MRLVTWYRSFRERSSSVEYLPWFSRAQSATVRAAAQPSAPNLTAVYLLPLMAVIAAGMISNAASDGFEWLYPLRLFAGAALLLYFRTEYYRLD